MRELAALLGEIGDLKRIHAAHATGSVAGRRFAGAWAALVGGEDVRTVALRETAAAVVGARLGAIDLEVLIAAGSWPERAEEALGRAFDAVADPIPEPLRGELRATIGTVAAGAGDVPPWVGALARQPRAGATRPGHARIMLQPEESHAEHCWTVAVGAVLCAPAYGAEVEAPFVCGLAHHVHNATLPDSGFAGEALLGGTLTGIIHRTTERALASLAEPLRGQVAQALALRDGAEVLDRVLEMRHHARVASFTVAQALEELDLVHEGPTQAFGLEVLEGAGLR